MFDQTSRSGIHVGLAAGLAFASAAPVLPTRSSLSSVAPQSINLSSKAVSANHAGTQAAVDTHGKQLGSIDALIKQTQGAILLNSDSAQAAKNQPASVGRQVAGAALGAFALPIGGPLGAILAMSDAMKIGGAVAQNLTHDTRSIPRPELLATRYEPRDRNGRRTSSFSSISLNDTDSGYRSARPEQAASTSINAGDIGTARSSLKGVKPSFKPERAQNILASLKARRDEEIGTLSVAQSLGFNANVTAPNTALKIASPRMSSRRGGLGGMALGMAA